MLGPVWNRDLAKQTAGEKETCEIIENIKKILGVSTLPAPLLLPLLYCLCCLRVSKAYFVSCVIDFLANFQVNRMVSGHTAQSKSGKVLSLCNGGYIGIDVGITAYYGKLLFPFATKKNIPHSLEAK